MTETRLKEIEQRLTSKLFPHGGFDEAKELIEAVRGIQQAATALIVAVKDRAETEWILMCNGDIEDSALVDACDKMLVYVPDAWPIQVTTASTPAESKGEKR